MLQIPILLRSHKVAITSFFPYDYATAVDSGHIVLFVLGKANYSGNISFLELYNPSATKKAFAIF